MLSSVFGISNGAASSEEALLKKQAEEMEEVRPSPFYSLFSSLAPFPFYLLF
jgi:hypothetical protein